MKKIYVYLLLLSCVFASPLTNFILEPLTAAYSTWGQMYFPASRADFYDSAIYLGKGAVRGKKNYTGDWMAGIFTGPLGLSWWQMAGQERGFLISTAVPSGRGISLGYTLIKEQGWHNSFSIKQTPVRQFAYGFSLENLFEPDFKLRSALSWRPYKEFFTFSYQYSLQYHSDEKADNIHELFASASLKNFLNIDLRYNFKEFWTGLSIRYDALQFSTLSSANDKDYMKTRQDFYELHLRANQEKPFRRDAKPAGRQGSIAVLHFKGAMQPTMGYAEEGAYYPSLLELHDIVNRVISSSRMKSMMFMFENYSPGWAEADELRQEILRLRAAGKEVHVYSHAFSKPAYYCAAAANRIYMNRTGSVDLKGMGGEGLYLSAFLERFGVSYDVIHAGNYKSALDTFIRTNMSSFSREEEMHLLKQFAERNAAAIRSGRSLTNSTLDLMNAGPYTASESVKAGLVDELTSMDSLTKRFSSKYRFVSLFDLYYDWKKSRIWAGEFDPSIAIIEVNGEIVEGRSFANPFTGGSGTGSDSVVRFLDAAANTRGVKAILLRVNSPGGSVMASDLIWQKVAEITAPSGRRDPITVIASFGDLAASGGYYISCRADKIFVMPNTITGSIGVIYGKPNVAGLMRKFDVYTDGVTLGKNADIDSLYKGFTEEQKEKVRISILEAYTNFIDIVYEGRDRVGGGGLTREYFESNAQGRVWTGSDALEKKLADSEGGMGDAFDYLLADYGIEDDYAFYRLYAEDTFFDRFRSASARSSAVMRLGFLTALPGFVRSGKITARQNLLWQKSQSDLKVKAKPADFKELIEREIKSKSGLQARDAADFSIK